MQHSDTGTGLPSRVFGRLGREVLPLAEGRQPMTIAGRTGPVFSLVFLPDGRNLASGGEDGVIRLWDPETGARRREIPTESRPVTSLACLPETGTLVSAGWRAVTVHSEPARSLPGLDSLALSLAVSPDGRLVAAGGWGAVVGWEAQKCGSQRWYRNRRR